MRQVLVRGEAKTIIVTAILLGSPDGRAFYARVGRLGQVARVEAELVPDETEELDDGRFRVVLTGTLDADETAKLSKGPADVSVRATAPLARLALAQVVVEDDMGVGGSLS